MIDLTSLRSRDCVTILNGKAFSKDCRELRRCACEKAAAMVKVQSLHEPLRELEIVRIELIEDFIVEPMLAAKFPHPLYCILAVY